MSCHQWWANPNPDLDLNPDLTTFAKSSGFGFGLDWNFFEMVDLDLSFFKVLDLDLKIAGFGFEDCKFTNPPSAKFHGPNCKFSYLHVTL